MNIIECVHITCLLHYSVLIISMPIIERLGCQSNEIDKCYIPLSMLTSPSLLCILYSIVGLYIELRGQWALRSLSTIISVIVALGLFGYLAAVLVIQIL